MSHWATKYGCPFNTFRQLSDITCVWIQGCVSFQTTQLSPCLPESDSVSMERNWNTFSETWVARWEEGKCTRERKGKFIFWCDVGTLAGTRETHHWVVNGREVKKRSAMTLYMETMIRKKKNKIIFEVKQRQRYVDCLLARLKNNSSLWYLGFYFCKSSETIRQVVNKRHHFSQIV